jgi:hypothetical protein
VVNAAWRVKAAWFSPVLLYPIESVKAYIRQFSLQQPVFLCSPLTQQSQSKIDDASKSIDDPLLPLIHPNQAFQRSLSILAWVFWADREILLLIKHRFCQKAIYVIKILAKCTPTFIRKIL